MVTARKQKALTVVSVSL